MKSTLQALSGGCQARELEPTDYTVEGEDTDGVEHGRAEEA